MAKRKRVKESCELLPAYVPRKNRGEKKQGCKALARFLDALCPKCKSRLRTDISVVWCSNPKCDFYIGGKNG